MIWDVFTDIGQDRELPLKVFLAKHTEAPPLACTLYPNHKLTHTHWQHYQWRTRADYLARPLNCCKHYDDFIQSHVFIPFTLGLIRLFLRTQEGYTSYGGTSQQITNTASRTLKAGLEGTGDSGLQVFTSIHSRRTCQRWPKAPGRGKGGWPSFISSISNSNDNASLSYRHTQTNGYNRTFHMVWSRCTIMWIPTSMFYSHCRFPADDKEQWS